MPLAKTGDYPNLQRRDVETWERFLEKHAAEWDACAYNVAVGGLEPELPNITEPERLGWRYTTALKIDVLLRVGFGLVVVEVKPVCSVSALGAALSYARMLAREEPGLQVQGAGVVCQGATPDMTWLAEQFNLRLWTV